jgi:hypothetical protein
MTRILVTEHSHVSLALAVALLDRDAFVEIGTGTITVKTDEPDLPAFNLPRAVDLGPPRERRRKAQWKSERKGRRP